MSGLKMAALSALSERIGMADSKVVLHLVRLIQDSPDVRYYVGGWGTQMRDLLVESLLARGHAQPLELLKPPTHRADDEPRVKQAEHLLDEVRAAARAYLQGGSSDARDRLRELL